MYSACFTHVHTQTVHLWFLFTSLLPRQPLLQSSTVLVTRKGKGRNREVIWMTNGRIHRKLREHSSSNYAISCLGEQRPRGRKRETEGRKREREMEGEKKNRHGLCVCGLEEEAGLKTTERERNL